MYGVKKFAWLVDEGEEYAGLIASQPLPLLFCLKFASL